MGNCEVDGGRIRSSANKIVTIQLANGLQLTIGEGVGLSSCSSHCGDIWNSHNLMVCI